MSDNNFPSLTGPTLNNNKKTYHENSLKKRGVNFHALFINQKKKP